MDFKFKGLTLNNTYYSLTDLADFCLYELIGNKDLSNWEKEVYGFIVEFISPTDSILQLTSGTTGTAKYIKIAKKEMIESAILTTRFFQLTQNKTTLLCLPIKYIAGKMMVVRAFVSGMNLVLTGPSGSPDFTSLGQIDFCAMVPLQVSNLLKVSRNLSDIKTLIIGGSEIESNLQTKLQEINTEVYETFGMTETCSHIALRKVNGTNSSNHFKVLDNVKIRLDERACLVIDAPFLKEVVRTNDMVELLDGNTFKWLGRFDNVINSGGIKIHPETLEKQIEKIIKTKTVILSEADELLGQKVIMVLENESAIFDEDQILNSLKQELPKHLVPKKIYTVLEFPRNKNLKIDRKKLFSVYNP